MKARLHERQGVRLTVWESGEGPTMMFQHGLCGDARQPADVFPAESRWRCCTLECRGHGQSDTGPYEELSIAIFTDDLISWIDLLEPVPVVLGGISMGAAVALRVAARRPDLIRALVLARPAWSDEDTPSNLRLNAFVGELLRRYSPD